MAKERLMCLPLSARIDELEDGVRAVDPAYVDAFESDAEATPPGPMTSGPQRLTMLVPTERTTLNLGQEVHPETKSQCLIGIDTGIGGRTDNHIDFQASASPKTTVNLGEPMTAPPSIERDAVPASVQGYGLATEGIAYHEAKLQHYVVSEQGDVILRAASGKSAVLNAVTGPAEVVAGGDISITAKGNVRISAGGYQPTTPQRAARWVTSSYASSSVYATEIGGALMGFFAGLTGAIFATQPPAKLAQDMAPGSTPSRLPDKLGMALTAVSTTCNPVWTGITVHGRGDAAVGAGRNAGIWGNASAAVISGLVSGLFGACADVKGFLTAGIVGGKDASLVALGKVGVKASKSLESYSKKETHITSRKAVAIEGERAHLEAKDTVAIYSEGDKAIILSQDFGIEVTERHAIVGKFTSTAKLTGAAHNDGTAYIKVYDDGVEIHNSKHNPSLMLSAQGAELKIESKYVKVDSSGNLHVNSDGTFLTLKG